MITEDYVSYEAAKLLKEKGFNWKCKTVKFYPEPDYDQESPDGISAPTLQMVMKWLREVHKLEIVLQHDCFQGNAWWYRIDKPYSKKGVLEESDAIYHSYEEACEEGIKYCLRNLL